MFAKNCSDCEIIYEGDQNKPEYLIVFCPIHDGVPKTLKQKRQGVRIVPYKETHQVGSIAIENPALIQSLNPTVDNDFGIQIASDGRVWICINGVSIIGFRPNPRTTTL